MKPKLTLSAQVCTLVFGCFASSGSLNALDWIDGGEFGTNTMMTSTSFLTNCYNSSTNQVIAVWSGTARAPTYAIFDGSSWSIAKTFAVKDPITDDIFCCYNNTSNQVVATWTDILGLLPNDQFYSSSFQNGKWSNHNHVSSHIFFNAFPVHYDNDLHQAVATWSDRSSVAQYATFNGKFWILGESPISDVGVSSNNPDIYCCYDKKDNILVATWVDGADCLHYAIFNGLAWTDNSFLTGAGTPQSNIFPCYDSSQEQVVALWVDERGFPHYATFDGSEWTDGGAFALLAGSQGDIFACFDGATNQLIATWADSNYLPHYAALQNGCWTDGGVFAASDGGVHRKHPLICSCFNSATNQIVATWTDQNSLPHYAVGSPSSEAAEATVIPAAAVGEDPARFPTRFFSRPSNRIR